MRGHTLKRWFLAATLALALPAVSHAAGLGRLTILSALGQPLNAEVELISVQKGETLSARLSSVDSYQRANLPFNAALVGARVTIEKRPNGTPYVKVTTPRPVSEPFAELLIEINSEHGRVTRQYTVLLDPPGYGGKAAELPPPAVAPPTVRAAPAAETSPAAPAAAAPGAPLESAPGPAAAPSRTPGAAPATRGRRGRGAAAPAPGPDAAESASAGAKQYGPIKPGETLGKIAKSVQPDGVTLEQTLVGLYRHNPDAFIKKNMNLVKSGRILKVPEANELTAIGQREAAKEVRLQVADFNAFRGRLAERAGAAPEDGSVSSGRIGTRVAKGEPAAPRDTVRLSRGEKGAKGAKGNAAERVRALEEEAVSREKALADANTRIGQLEKTIQDMKRLAEMKSGAPADKAAAAPPPAAKGPGGVAVAPVVPPPPVAKAPEPVTKAAPPPVVAKGPEPVPGKAPEPAPAAKSAEITKGGPSDIAKGGPSEAPTQVAKGPEAKSDSDLPKPKPKAKPVPPPPPPEPDLIDTIMDEPLYLVAGAGAIVLVGLGLIAVARRRGGAAGGAAPKLAPAPAPAAPPSDAKREAAAAATAAPVEPARPAAAPPASPAAPARGGSTASISPEDNDLDFNANMRSAAAAAPRVEPPPPKRVEPAPPPKVAEAPRAKPPEPPRAEPRREPPKVEPRMEPAARDDLTRMPEPARGAAPPAVKPSTTGLAAARSLEGGATPPRAPEAAPPAKPTKADMASADLPDFSLEIPPAGAQSQSPSQRPAPAAAADFNMDFNLEPLPPIEIPGEQKPAQPTAPPAAQSNDLEFKLDDINLDFGGGKSAAAPAAKGPKDDHWYDVQQKFDLAKAYEEMGDKDGARDILNEVVKEGDADQQAQAKKLLSTLA